MALLWFSLVAGAVAGSFLTTVIERLPQGESFTRGRSRCPHCGTRLRVIELIPVLSFLLFGGRCRTCGKAIPRWQVGVEVLMMLLSAALAWTCGECRFPDLFLRFGMLTLLVALASIDLQAFLLPNTLVGMFGVLAAVRTLWPGIGIPGVGPSLIGAALGGMVLGGLWVFPHLLRRFTQGPTVIPDLMGLGDVKLAAALGIALGPLGLAATLYSAFVLGGATGAILLASRRAHFGSRIPFGPFLVSGALLFLLLPDLPQQFLQVFTVE